MEVLCTVTEGRPTTKIHNVGGKVGEDPTRRHETELGDAHCGGLKRLCSENISLNQNSKTFDHVCPVK